MCIIIKMNFVFQEIMIKKILNFATTNALIIKLWSVEFYLKK